MNNLTSMGYELANHPYSPEFYLVQRMQLPLLAPTERDRGIDRDFGFDYMGSSEFECGLVHRALQHIRTLDLLMDRVEVFKDGKRLEISLIAPTEHYDQAAARLQAWLDDPRPPYAKSIESAGFEGKFPEQEDSYEEIIAWWSLGSGIAWTIDPSITEKLLYHFQHTPKPV